jgi:hypothetical protein
MTARAQYLIACVVLLASSGAAAQEPEPPPEPPAPAIAPQTPTIEPQGPAVAPQAPAVDPQPPAVAPRPPAIAAQPAPVEPRAPVDSDALVLAWQGRVITGFELERERPSEEQGGPRVDDYGFFLDQARLKLEGEWKDLELDVSVDLGDAIRPRTSSAAFKRPPYLRNAHLNYRVHKAFRIRAGRFKRPFSGLELTSSGVLPFRGRGLGNDLIVEEAQWGDRGLGLMFWGRLPGKLRWYLSAHNPGWAPDGDLEVNGVDTLARVEWKPADIVELGLSLGHKLEARQDLDVHGNGASFDATLDVSGLRVGLDAMLAQLTNQASEDVDAPLAYALVLHASYQIPLGGDFALEPVLFGEYAEADAELSRTQAVRLIAGFNLRVADHLRVMPQVEIKQPVGGDAAAINPWQSGESYYLMIVGRL